MARKIERADCATDRARRCQDRQRKLIKLASKVKVLNALKSNNRNEKRTATKENPASN
jgi:hypothetical protein